MTRLFGTDGIRGKAGAWPLVPEFLERLGRALAHQLRVDQVDDEAAHALLGHDGRASGEDILAGLAEGLRRGGVDVDVLGLCSTPALAHLTATGPYRLGVMVSASHNPAEDNGVKVLGHDGAKLPGPVEEALEAELEGDAELPDAPRRGALRRNAALLGDYVAWLRTQAFPELELGGMRVLVDCANGGASELAPRVLHAFGADVVQVHCRPDGHNINRDCGATRPEAAAAAVVEERCEVGLTLDGDADRGLLVDGDGRILDGDALLAGLGRHMEARGALPHDTVVATVMSNLALESWLAESGVTLVRTPVGDRHVAAAMREGGYALGGEKSGHLLFGPEHGYRGDGIYTFLKVMQVLHEERIGPRDFAAGYRDLPQELRNLRVLRKPPLDELERLQAAIREVEETLGDGGRVVVRFSGTEDSLRLMVEAETSAAVTAAVDRLEAAAREEGILAD